MRANLKSYLKYIIDVLLFFAIILSIGWTVLAVYWIGFDANPPATFSSPLAVDKAVYNVGDSIVVTFNYCRYTSAPATIYNSLVGEIVYNLPPREIGATAKLGCGVTKVTSASIPSGIISGTYYLKTRSEFVVNPLATRFTEWHTVEFEVIGE